MLGDQSAEQVIEHLAELADGDVLSRVVVSAQIDADGRLSEVGGIKAKLAALFGESPFAVLASTGHFPPRVVGIAHNQADLLGHDGIQAYRQPTSLPRLCFQETFAGLVADLRVQQSQREGFVPKRFVEALQHQYKSDGFKGRRWLFEHIQEILEARKNGLVVLEAGPGFGKTAFLLELIRQYGGRQLGPAWVLGWHILRRDHRDWLPTATIASQLEWQLRDRLLMPLPAGESKAVTSQTAPAVLRQVLEEAKEKLKTADQKLLVVIDGLDEAFGSNTPVVHDRDQRWMLQDLFPNPLPDGVFILLTSRPGDHLEQFGHRSDLVIIDPENLARTDLGDANRQDLREYLTTRITEYGEAHTAFEAEIQSVVERMMAGCEGAFFVAEWFGRKETLDRRDPSNGPTNFERWCEPGAKLPSGIDEMLGEDWRYKRRRLEQAGREAHAAYEAHLPVIATVLALWHDLGTKPTDALIEDMIHGAADAASRHEPTVPRREGKLLTSAITPECVEAVLGQLADWCEVHGGPEPTYVFRHSRIPELILETLVTSDGGPRLVRQVHALLAWSAAIWGRLQGDSRTVALRNLLPHLIETAKDAREVAKQLADTLLDYKYLVAALGADPKSRSRPLLITNLAEHARQADPLTSQADPSTAEAITLLADALTLSIPALSRDPTALPSQLRGRLGELNNERLAALTQQVDDGTHWAWLRPVRASLTSVGGAEVRRMEGHTDWVYHVALHADGQRAVSASWDKTLRVWDLERGTCVTVLEGHTAAVIHVALHADGRRAVSASWDKTLRVWDLERGTCLATLKGHTKGVNHVALHADGRRAVSASWDKTLRVWDLERGTCLATLKGHTNGVNHVALHADGRRAVSSSEDNTLRVWDLERGMCVAALEGHTDWVTHVALHADGRRAVSASVDKTLRVWELERGTCLATLKGHTKGVNHVALHADGRRAVSASLDKTLRVWDLERGTCVAKLEGHTDWVNHVALHADGKRAVSASLDKALRVWDLDGGTCLAVLVGHTRGRSCHVALHADGLRAVSPSEDGTLRVWNLERGTCVAAPEEHTQWVLHMALHADGRRAVSASRDRTLRVWDLERGTCLAVLEGHTNSVLHVTLHADGRRAVSASVDDTLRVWDLERGTCLAVLEGHANSVLHVALHADGRRAVSASRDRTLRVWDLERGMCVAALEGHTRAVTHVALHADGRRAVSASLDKTLRVWDLERGMCVAALEGHTDSVRHVALHADGRRAVSASRDDTLRVWDLERGACVAALDGHTDSVRNVALHPDGRRAVSASHDKTLRVWDLERGTCLATLEGHTDGVFHVALHADGRRVVSASLDKTLRVWDLDTGTTTHVFSTDATVYVCEFAPDRATIIAGDEAGRVHFLRLAN